MVQLALSTMWMQNRHRSLAEFFEAASQLGFDRFELNHFVSQELVESTRFQPETIQGVHAPCPTYPSTRDAEISSPDKEERARAVEAATASIRLAEQLGAPVVILHAGTVPVDPRLDSQLRDLYNRGQKHTGQYDDLKAELAGERAHLAERCLDNTRRSLERLADVADAAGVRLGLENRFSFQEIPIPDELDLLLCEFAGPVGFWLDTGHAYVLEELGFIDHAEWLTGFGPHLVGAHLHDVCTVPQSPPPDAPPAPSSRRLRDHDIPGSGVVNFGEALCAMPPAALLTCEVETYHAPEQVKAGLEYLHSLNSRGGDR
jgi:sugar phosphate isomerase/epimerase